MTKAEALEFSRAVQGWMTEEQLEWLYDMASSFNYPVHWLEVGAWKGRSLSMVAAGLPADSWVHAVDRFDGGDDATDLAWVKAQEAGPDGIYNAYMDTVLRFEKRRQDVWWQTIRADSLEAAKAVRDGTMDVVFIDGTHTTEAVLADIRAWLPKVKPGGLFCGHDWSDRRVREGIQRSGIRVRKTGVGIWAKV